MKVAYAQQTMSRPAASASSGRTLPVASWSRTTSSLRACPVRRRHHSATAHSRFFNIQIQASWGNGGSSSSGGEAYADATPRWGGFLNSSSSSSGGGGSAGGGNGGSSSSSSGGADSPITRLLSSAAAHVKAAPLPGAAARWLVLPLVPVVVWCVGWVFTTGMFTLAQCSMSGMCSVARALYPSIPLRGASYEDIAVSLVKALGSGTDSPSTWTRPGLLLPWWVLRWLMGSLYGLAAAGTGVAGSLMHSPELLAVTGVCKGLMYVSCLLFMMPLGSGLNSLAAALQQQLQRLKGAAASQEPGGSSGSYGSSSGSSNGGYGSYGSSSAYGAAASSSSSSSSSGWSLPSLSDTSALALKLAGVLAWPCISAAAVLQPSLLLQANSATAPLSIAAPQVLLCCCLLSLLLTVAVAAAGFSWALVRRQADEAAVVDFGLQLGLLCGAGAGLTAVQLLLGLVGGQLELQQLGMPLLSTLILCRVAWSTWRLWRIGRSAPAPASLWLQLLTLTPALGTGSSSSSRPGDGSSGSSGGYVRG